MAQNGTKNGKYAVQGIETLRAKINREFIIRLSKRQKSVGWLYTSLPDRWRSSR